MDQQRETTMTRATITTDAPSDLALCIINDGDRYRDRYALALREGKATSGFEQRMAAREWLAHANEGAGRYQDGRDEPYTCAEILAAAVELRTYYAAHVLEG